MKSLFRTIIVFNTTFCLSTAWAAELTVPNIFTSGTPAVAAEVNANFNEVKVEVDDNNSRINNNASDISANTNDINANALDISVLQANPLPQWVQSGSDIYYNTGNIGIGIITPIKNIDILETVQSTNADIRMSVATNNISSIELLEGGASPFAGAVLRYDGAWDEFKILVDIKYPVTAEKIRISRSSNNIGLGGAAPTQPLIMPSGAYVTAGGVWTNASSREYKEDIRKLSLSEATAALEQLNPVRFYYKKDLGDEQVGFISEDVPAIVATKDRKGLSPMDIAAVLTKIVQSQQKQIETLRQEINHINKGAKKL